MTRKKDSDNLEGLTDTEVDELIESIHEGDSFAQLRAEVERLRAALVVYADERSWKRSRSDGPIDEWISLEYDKWDGPELARAALGRKP